MALPILVLGQTTTENFVKTTTYKKASTLTPNPTAADFAVQITYIDGLGRPMQQVASQQSATGKDIITHIEYDAFGRQPKDYLPYASTTATGAFDGTALSNTTNFALYAGQNPYSEKLFENSPLNRVMKQAASGTDWSMGAGHEIKLDYQSNLANEVKRYVATATWNTTSLLYDIALVDNGYYEESQLYKTITFDENTNTNPTETNGSTVEFKDKEGKVILKRTYESGAKHETYYVYDLFGNLTYVFPPLVNTSNAVTQTILDGLCYQYKYDARNRLVEKKIPGKQWEFMVYDKLDRVIATGPAFSPFTDAVAPNNIGWLITKYDAFNRSVYTGWKQSTTVTAAGRVVLQNQQNALTTTLNETKATSTTIDAVAVGYTNVVAPTAFKLLIVNYYDDYNYPDAPTTFGTVLTQPVYYNNTTQKPKGMPTGSWVRVLETSALANAEKSYILYDYKARPIRSYMQNYMGGYTQTDSNLDFAGKTIYTETRHKRIATSTELLTRENFTYTAQDRLLTQTHIINGGTPQLIAKNTYNELGQLTSKNVGGTDVTGAIGLQKVDYTYNIRGWLTSINNIANLAQGTNPLDLFAFKINYNTIEGSVAGVNKLYNGNIAETYWRSGSDNILRKYGYNYDQLNRLRNAIYQKPDSPNPVPGSYNESLNYDKNGNIMHLDRCGSQDSDSNTIPTIKMDDLNYVYAANTNQLLKVSDATNSTLGFKDGSNTTNDYAYDANGNMVVDNNKSITGIVYNHLNLPNKINFANGGIITYFYNAMGQKVKKVVLENAVTTTTDYLTGYQYKNTALQFFPTAEGYVNFSEPQKGSGAPGGTYNYAFNYLDHLGNVRLTYSQDPVTLNLRIMEENHYYPFGLKHSGYNSDQLMYIKQGTTTKIVPVPPLFKTSYDVKFQNQKREEDLALNWDSFKWRNYDYAIGRFMSIDPLAEKMPSWSPYNFCFNNPLTFVDPDGRAPDWHREGSVLVADAGDTAETLAAYKGISTQEARAEFNHSHFRFESTMSGGEKFYGSDRYNPSGAYGPSYGPAMDEKISLGIIGAMAAPILAAEGGLAYLGTEAMTAFSQMSWGSAASGIAINTVSQGIANVGSGGSLGDINTIEALSSAVPGVGSTIFGETFNLPISSVLNGNFRPTVPKTLDQAVLQIGGGLLSNSFGNKIDASPLFGNGVGQVYKEVAKFSVETGSNALPNLGN